MTPRQTAEKTTTPARSARTPAAKPARQKRNSSSTAGEAVSATDPIENDAADLIENDASAGKSAPAGKSVPAGKSAPAASRNAPVAKRAATPRKAVAEKTSSAGKEPVRPSKSQAARVGSPDGTSRSANGQPGEPGVKPPAHTSAASFRGIAVPPGDDPWTGTEALAVERQLHLDIERLRDEIAAATDHLDQLHVGGGGSSGEDPVDSGAKAYEREAELSIIGNAQHMVSLCEDALARLADGRYGTCDSCGGPIRKMRLQAFPRASKCLPCKQRAERH